MAGPMGAFMTRMLVTRPEPDAEATILRLRALDIDGIAGSLMVRQTLDISLPAADGFAALALTSTNGLRALAERGALDAYRRLPVYAVGARTAFEAEGSGFARVTDAGGTLDELINVLSRAELRGPVFYPAGRHLSADLAKSLAPFGVMVVTARIYDMVPVERLPQPVMDELETGGIAAALFYSRRTAELFVSAVADALGQAQRSNLAVLCLSEGVAEPLVEAHFNRVSLADRPDEEAMMSLALAFAREQNGS
jgi:uroporphyrinogen-III synthase